ncbi:MAG TPA: hypothetical protein QF753_18850 [Victivallales bacterium]|nr:hypothetical protein [Victivallales bacterium]
MLPLIRNKKSGSKSKNSYLSEMNMPALIARHNAAYDQAIYLFNDNMFSKSEEERSEIYKIILKLLDIAIEARRSLPQLSDLKKELQDPITQYLLLLKDTIQAAYALVTHEMILFQEEKQLSNFIGSEISTQFRSTDEIFANSELNICHSTTELIEMAESAINRHRERILKSFLHEDRHRYNKSFNEFTKLYQTFGIKTK